MVSAKEALKVLSKKLTNRQLEAMARISRLMYRGAAFHRKCYCPSEGNRRLQPRVLKEKKAHLSTVLGLQEQQLFLLPT